MGNTNVHYPHTIYRPILFRFLLHYSVLNNPKSISTLSVRETISSLPLDTEPFCGLDESLKHIVP